MHLRGIHFAFPVSIKTFRGYIWDHVYGAATSESTKNTCKTNRDPFIAGSWGKIQTMLEMESIQ